jgi:hypothetical protein
MRAFTCERCGQLLFFENSRCLRCGAGLGFVPQELSLRVLDDPSVGLKGDAQRCGNAGVAQCNWIVGKGDAGPLCGSCVLTRTRPADGETEALAELAVAEAAKRRLLFQLLDLGLGWGEDLAFDLLTSRSGPVVTGHHDGLITIDLAESDDASREQRRAELGEPYRTLLGHFRHEIGHYYWPRLVERSGALEAGRALFGDERLDYEEALSHHYEHGAPHGWAERFVSAYATMHPWEDWAETFAHYLHIRDTLETAGSFGVIVAGPPSMPDPALIAAPSPETARSFTSIVDEWLPLTYALNAVNRSMGRDDLYPFTLAPTVIEKLAFVHHQVLVAAAGSPP